MEQIQHISFHIEDVKFELQNSLELARWLEQISLFYQKTIDQIEYIFCSDEYLLAINKKHLDHDYYTDIITFPFDYNPIEATIYISVDRVKDNAAELSINFKDELHRVIAHGLLHMIGFNDKDENDEKVMRQAEDKALNMRKF